MATGASESASTRGGGRSRSRDPRPAIYAALDLVMAGLYGVVLFALIPSRHLWVQILSGLLVASALAMAGSMLVRRPWSRAIAIVACAALLALAILFLLLTLASAAFLAGVYGSLGLAASALAVIVAALVVELLALLPAFQLKFLMTRAGRRSFGVAAPAPRERPSRWSR